MGFDAFRIVDELATVLDPDTWMLVGGLMVHAHAQLAGLQSNRPTYDADIVVEVEVQPTGRYRVAAAALERIGFRHQEPVVLETPSYRFERGSTEVIDLMATDRTPASRFAGRPVLQVPASASAAKHTEPVTTPGGTTIRVPTLPGAISTEGCRLRNDQPPQDSALPRRSGASGMRRRTRHDSPVEVTAPLLQRSGHRTTASRGMVAGRCAHDGTGRANAAQAPPGLGAPGVPTILPAPLSTTPTPG